MKAYDRKIQEVVYECRELISTYFYPDISPNLIGQKGSARLQSELSDHRFRNDRIIAEAIDKRKLLIKGAPFAKLSRNPNKIVLYHNIINHSQDTLTIGSKLIADINKFLPEIKIVNNRSAYTDYNMGSFWDGNESNNITEPVHGVFSFVGSRGIPLEPIPISPSYQWDVGFNQEYDDDLSF